MLKVVGSPGPLVLAASMATPKPGSLILAGVQGTIGVQRSRELPKDANELTSGSGPPLTKPGVLKTPPVVRARPIARDEGPVALLCIPFTSTRMPEMVSPPGIANPKPEIFMLLAIGAVTGLFRVTVANAPSFSRTLPGLVQSGSGGLGGPLTATVGGLGPATIGTMAGGVVSSIRRREWTRPGSGPPASSLS